MQHIPDRQFDKLFKDKFAEAEIEPSADLWANIEKQLAPKKKRVIPIYWMAAASVAIAISAMLVFSKKEVIKLQGGQETAIVVKPAIVRSQTVVETQLASIPLKANDAQKTKVSFASKTANVKDKSTNNKLVESNLENTFIAMQPINENNRLPIKQQEVKPLDVVPIKEVVIDYPTMIAKVEVPQSIEDNAINENTAPRKGIRNVGDLVNYVVDKVDKRDKKLLRFNTDDDDNSSLIGINIGFLKLNKKNK